MGLRPHDPQALCGIHRLHLGKNPSALIARPLPAVPPLLGLLRLRYVHEIRGPHSRVFAPGFTELPRAAIIPHWRVVPDRNRLLEAMTETPFDPHRMVFLEEDPGIESTESVPAEAEDAGVVSVVDLSTDVMEVSADVRRPAVLVISDNYSTGWNIIPLDDAPQSHYRLLPANGTLRAIPLVPGRHHLRLEYKPMAFVIGSCVTVVSLVTYALCVVVWARRRARSIDRVELRSRSSAQATPGAFGGGTRRATARLSRHWR